MAKMTRGSMHTSVEERLMQPKWELVDDTTYAHFNQWRNRLNGCITSFAKGENPNAIVSMYVHSGTKKEREKALKNAHVYQYE